MLVSPCTELCHRWHPTVRRCCLQPPRGHCSRHSQLSELLGLYDKGVRSFGCQDIQEAGKKLVYWVSTFSAEEMRWDGDQCSEPVQVFGWALHEPKKKKKSRTKVELSTLGNRQDLAQQWENFTPSIWVQETSPGYDDQGSEGCFASAGMRNQFSVYQTHLP